MVAVVAIDAKPPVKTKHEHGRKRRFHRGDARAAQRAKRLPRRLPSCGAIDRAAHGQEPLPTRELFERGRVDTNGMLTF
jgi:hypothetical protein